MKTKFFQVQLTNGLANVFVEDGCGETRVSGSIQCLDRKAGSHCCAELKERLELDHLGFLGAYHQADGRGVSLDLRVPSRWNGQQLAVPTVREVCRMLGKRWSKGLIETD